MSAAAISAAPSTPPGASAATGATGAHAQAGQAHGLPAVFEAMLATLQDAENAATGAAAGSQATPGGKLPAGTVKASADDAKTKGKAADDSKTATTATDTTPTASATVALLTPSVPMVPVQAAPTTVGDEGETAQAATAVGAGKTAAAASAAALVQAAAAADDDDAEEGKTTTVAANVGGAGVDASATLKLAPTPPKTDATAPQPQIASPALPDPQTPAAPSAPVPAIPTPSTPAAALAAAQAAALPATAAATPHTADAKTADPAAAQGAKAPPPKTARAANALEQAAADAPAEAAASTSAKIANALQAVTNGGSKGRPSDKDDAAPLSDVPADQPETAQAPANPGTSSTTTPATQMQAAAVAVRGSPETVANLAAQIVKQLDGRSTQFNVQLDPAGLGKVDVRVQIGSDGKMTAAMSFDTPQAAAELKSRSAELHQAMEQSGFDLSGGMSFDVASDRGQGGQAQNQQPDTGAAFRGRAFQAALDTVADAAPAPQLTLRRTALSGVDIRI